MLINKGSDNMRMLICKDSEQNTLLEARPLEENDNSKYYIIDNAPEMEYREGYYAKYSLNENGEVYVEYIKIPPSKDEELQEQINELQDVVMTLANTIYS